MATPDHCVSWKPEEKPRHDDQITSIWSYVHDQVLAGRFRAEDDVILDALERHRQAQQPPAAPAIRRDKLSGQEVQQRLFDAGLISEIKPRSPT